jgi:hypothetical protein
MKLTRISITNLLGIAALETAIHPDGAIATGGNAAGKTSFIKAVRAALESAGVDSSAIRIGSERSEILLDTDAALRIRRGITHTGSSLTVTNKDGDRWSKPQTRLTELVGATLDPLAFYLASPDERRKQILTAMPVTVTTEDLKRWTGDDWDVKEGRHGLEVIAEVRKDYYEARTEANRVVKAAEAACKAALGDADLLATPDLADIVVPPAGEEDKTVLEAEQRKRELEQQQRAAVEHEKRTEGTRARIAAIRDEAETLANSQVKQPTPESLQETESAIEAVKLEYAETKRKLGQLEARWQTLTAQKQEWIRSNEVFTRVASEWATKKKQAEALEASLAETAIVQPTAEEFASADAAITEAKRHADLIQRARAAKDARGRSTMRAADLADAEEKAAKLDTIVQRLTTDAPAEVAKRSQAIPGLSFSDKGITLDGKAIDNLSGAEQLRFAVDLAKRASKAKILVVDGLERLDRTRLREFVSYATAGGFQLLATLVTDGPLHIVEPSKIGESE